MLKKLLKKLIPENLLRCYHLCLAFLGALIYRFPSKKIRIIGVTGTSGKSTVVELISFILQESGLKIASLSSVKFRIGAKEKENRLKMTMPGRFKLQKFLHQAAKEKCQYVMLEVTSEGIKQHRHRFIEFDTAVFTNLSKEHIESHKGFDNYKKAKARLFQSCKKTHIINLDDKNSSFFWQIPAQKKIGYGSADFSLLPKNPNLKGRFNLYNTAAAAKTALHLGVSPEQCQKALTKFPGIRGRMEIIIKKPFSVIVDYAHTPEQLKQVLKTILSDKAEGSEIICVLGSAGGGRDKWKRPVLGKVACEYCSQIIITNEDPYDEDPGRILAMIKSGILNSKFQMSNFHEILDRRQAIRKALSLAKSNDTVIITGKGSEPWMCIGGGKKIPWDDREITREEIKNTG